MRLPHLTTRPGRATTFLYGTDGSVVATVDATNGRAQAQETARALAARANYLGAHGDDLLALLEVTAARRDLPGEIRARVERLAEGLRAVLEGTPESAGDRRSVVMGGRR